MLCEKCGQREATSHFKQTINGKTTVYHVCAQCAEQMGLNNLFHGFHFNIGDMFGGLLGSVSSGSAPSLERKVCPECHSDLKSISETGRMGCARCYTTFRNELLPTIEQLHGRVNHQESCRVQPERKPEKSAAEQFEEKAGRGSQNAGL